MKIAVSTHSRPKAAAPPSLAWLINQPCFNTQPPEGGCLHMAGEYASNELFQHTAARRRLPSLAPFALKDVAVSTHSRPKAAADRYRPAYGRVLVSTHSRPKAAARRHGCPAVGRHGFNTQPPEGGCRLAGARAGCVVGFQHTAARRRLPIDCISTHAAGMGFNTQPPEGGCRGLRGGRVRPGSFNTQPPEGGCFRLGLGAYRIRQVSTHSRPKAAAKWAAG